MAEFQVINPALQPVWNEMLLHHEDYSFFHTSQWARVLTESYRYEPRYFTLMDQGKVLVSMPLMEVHSLLTGRRGVSLPFSDYCDPLLSRTSLWKDVFRRVRSYGERSGWRSLEMRGGGDLLRTTAFCSASYRVHTLALSYNEGRLFSNLRGSVRRNIRKAEREGVTITLDHSPDSLSEFCRLNSLTRKAHGLPPQPARFFRNVYDHVLAGHHGFVALARHGGTAVAGAVCFHVGTRAHYKFGASDRRYQHLRPNDLLMWNVIQWYARRGYTRLCLGRTEMSNQGLRRFKAGWGGTERTVKYYTYDFRERAFVANPSIRWHVPVRAFRRLPIPVSRVIGKVLYRHVG